MGSWNPAVKEKMMRALFVVLIVVVAAIGTTTALSQKTMRMFDINLDDLEY